MSRAAGRSFLLFPTLVLAALAMFLVPEAHVQTLRGRTLSLLRPVLSAAGPRSDNPALKPALIKAPVVTVAAPAKPETNYQIYESALIEIQQLRSELAKLQSATGHSAQANIPTGISAQVIARKVLWQEPVLALDRGEADGVRLHAGVLHRGAVLGRVISAGPRASCIALLTHKGLSVSARLADCRIEGVLQGEAPKSGDLQSERHCRLSIVAKELNAKIGENVVTSGHDGAFPAGLWIGTVVEIKKRSDVQWELKVRPACAANAVECVTVLPLAQPEIPWPAQPRRR